MKIPAKLLNRLLNSRSNRPQRRRRRNRRRANTARSPVMRAGLNHPVAIHHARALVEPATADISKLGGVYDGESGNITRFSLDYTIVGGATTTAAYLIFHPNTGYVMSGAVVASSTAITPSFGVGGATTPGYTILTAAARKVRGVACGTRFNIPSMSITNLVGEVAVGVVSADTFVSPTSFTIDQLFTHAGASGPLKRTVHNCCWYPGSFDSKYSSFTASGLSSTGTDLSDTNLLYFAIRGLPNNTNVNWRLDWVVEYVALAGSGVSPNYSVNAGTDHQSTVSHLHKNHPGFWHTIKSEVESAGKEVLKELAGQGKRKVEKWAPSMLESGFAAFGL